MPPRALCPRARAEPDAVVVTSPDDTHAAIAAAPTAVGVPVCAEKPSATRPPTVSVRSSGVRPRPRAPAAGTSRTGSR
ncbi:Gfo/Idh/MocA family oxidoreductase [Streptomyces sp. NPDC001276]|uniref:Gfo/Idh/MocA family oxidoreductase n=1 Tax=Streptomyces sp. NPDC001276 TaxID=3364555 RepID=UPI00368EBFF5